ncbi:MAG: hypothetical protein HY925_08500 [Elusimicrobia bacterium]|nr:hypothetical protein [Elusimicrobiota bacterium]
MHGAIVWAVLGLFSGGAGAESSCVACHESAGAVPYLEHNFEDWKRSPHAKAGESCEACHGGDASKLDKSAAHAGMLPSTDPKSRVYFTKVPGTCGACHAAEENAFKKSRHAAELARTGKGPNCVTCHGSMANHVLAPRELEMTCTLCHRKPTRAYVTLLSLNTAEQALRRLETGVERASRVGVDVKAQETALSHAKSLYYSAGVEWHTFKMDAVLKASQEAARQANTAASELELKESQHGGKPKP